MDTINSIRLWHLGNNLMVMIMRILPPLMLSIMLAGCEPDTEIVSIDDVYWSAFRNPVSFDAYLDAQSLDPRSSNCFLQHSNAVFKSEEAKLLECSVILVGSPAWNECHEEAEAFHNQGVIMKDIASAIDGPIRFDETQAYAYLIIAKSVFTEVEWNAFIDSLDEVTPAFYCEYEGDKKWFWE